MHQLTQIMRQRGDSAFCELLCRIRTNECTAEDIAVLKSRETSASCVSYPKQALHVFRMNVDVDSHNTFMLNSLAPTSNQFTIKAVDTVASQTSHIDLKSLSTKRNETGGLHTVLKLAVGAHVTLTTNIDVSDGLVNGARGEVIEIITTNYQVTTVLVKFNSSEVGTAAIQSNPYSATLSL